MRVSVIEFFLKLSMFPFSLFLIVFAGFLLFDYNIITQGSEHFNKLEKRNDHCPTLVIVFESEACK